MRQPREIIEFLMWERGELGKNEDMEKTLHLKELLLADVIEAEIKLSKAKIETAMNTIKTTRIK